MKKDWHHLYNTARWYRLRYKQLQAFPCCKYCDDQGRVTLATVVDHKTPHKGNEDLFFDPDNLQSICEAHHNSSKQRAENKGMTDFGCDAAGYPYAPEHHWNK